MAIRNWIDFMRFNWKRDDGQTMAEYGVVLAVITLGVIAAIGLLATAISGNLTSVKNVLTP
jgi:Flp pilus assembly pilin Flp